MTEIAIAKKPASQGWHPAFIVYQLRLRGLSLRRLARKHGYSPNTFTTAMHRPVATVELLIARALDVKPQEIWPERYNADGTPKRGFYRHGSPYLKPNTARRARNGHVEERK